MDKVIKASQENLEKNPVFFDSLTNNNPNARVYYRYADGTDEFIPALVAQNINSETIKNRLPENLDITVNINDISFQYTRVIYRDPITDKIMYTNNFYEESFKKPVLWQEADSMFPLGAKDDFIYDTLTGDFWMRVNSEENMPRKGLVVSRNQGTEGETIALFYKDDGSIWAEISADYGKYLEEYDPFKHGKVFYDSYSRRRVIFNDNGEIVTIYKMPWSQ
jgi:hypothetical protein